MALSPLWCFAVPNKYICRGAHCERTNLNDTTRSHRSHRCLQKAAPRAPRQVLPLTGDTPIKYLGKLWASNGQVAVSWGGGWVGLGWVKASPGRLPTVRAAFPAGPDRAAVPGCPVTRPTGLLTAPRPRGGARGREMPPCLCVCALVCLWRGGGGAVAHLLAPLLFGVGAHGAGKCVPGAPGPGREAGEPDSEPAGGDVGLGSQPPRH